MKQQICKFLCTQYYQKQQWKLLKPTTNNLLFFVPTILRACETPVLTNSSIKENLHYGLFFWTTDRRVIDTQIEDQFDLRSVHETNSPVFFTKSNQTDVWAAYPIETSNTASVANLNVIIYFVKKDGIRFPTEYQCGL